MAEQRKWFFEMETIPGKKCYEDCCNDKKDLEYYKNLADTARGGLEKIDSYSERSSTMSQMLSNSIACHLNCS